MFCDIGEYQRGLEYMQKAVALGYFPVTTLERWPQFDGLRDDPGFQQLIADAVAGQARARTRSAKPAASACSRTDVRSATR